MATLAAIRETMMSTPDIEKRLEQTFWDNVRRLCRWAWCAATCCFALFLCVIGYAVLFALRGNWNAMDSQTLVSIIGLVAVSILFGMASAFLIAEAMALSLACRQADMELFTSAVRIVRYKTTCLCLFILALVVLLVACPVAVLS